MKFFLINWILFTLIFTVTHGKVNWQLGDWQLWVTVLLIAAVNVSGFIEGRFE